MRRQINENELRDFYGLIGEALWQVQYLEQALVSLLIMKIVKERRCAGKEVTKEDGEALIAEKQKLTLGLLIDACVKMKIVQRKEQGRFAAFKHERHWLVHRSLTESGDQLYESAQRLAMCRRIEAIGNEAASLKKMIFADLVEWGSAHGISADEAYRRGHNAISVLKGESTDS